MQPNPYMYNAYPNPNGAQPTPVRYAVPQGYRQPSPPYANQSFDRYAGMAGVRPPQGVTQPVRYPQGYGQGYYQPIAPTQSVPTSPRAQRPQRQSVDQLQPPQPYYYNPYGPNGASPSGSPGPRGAAPKKGGKEYKDNAFTIAPDGAHNESIKGLVSNNDINNLLKHKGTKVKISKIYRITKTKPAALNNDSSDEEIPPKVQQPTPAPTQVPFAAPLPPPALAPAPAPAPKEQRPVSSSSSDSHCSTCSYCSCSDCRHHRRSHTYDDCPDCRAERERERTRRRRRH